MLMEIGDLLKNSWETFSKGLVTNILVVLVGSFVGGLIGAFTLGILGIPVFAGVYKALRKAQQGGTAEISDLFGEFGNLGKWFKLWLLLIAYVIVSGLTFGLGALAGSFLLFFTLMLMLDKDMDAFDAAKASFEYVSKNFGAAFVPILVCILVSSAGSIVFGVGALVTVPMMMIGGWFLYDAAFGDGADAAAG